MSPLRPPPPIFLDKYHGEQARALYTGRVRDDESMHEFCSLHLRFVNI